MMQAATSRPSPVGLLPRRVAAAAALVALVSGCAITPAPITTAERAATIELDLAAMYKDQAPLAGPLLLEEAMARAVKFNLENRLRMMEEALGLGQLDQARYDMLPRLALAAGYTSRNNELVTDSIDVGTRRINLSNSTSQDRTRQTMDLSLTWNALDFGVSYFQAQQQGDRALILRERRRKTVHNLMQQVRQAYWQAAGAQALESQVDPLLAQVNRALADSEQASKEKLRPPLELLSYRKALIDLVRQLEAIRDELGQAKPRLAALMNLPLGQAYTLAIPAVLPLPAIQPTVAQLEKLAMFQRPELVEGDLQERIAINEVKKSIARMFPGLELNFGPHFDSNSYLHNAKWVEGGLRVTWNLFSVLSGPRQKAVAERQVDVSRLQRLALDMAILTQVHVAVREFAGRRRQYDLSQELLDIDRQINEQTTTGANNDAQSRLNAIRSGAAQLMADYRRYQSYASLQTAHAQVIASIGTNPLPEELASDDIPTLTAAIRSRMNATSNDTSIPRLQ